MATTAQGGLPRTGAKQLAERVPFWKWDMATLMDRLRPAKAGATGSGKVRGKVKSKELAVFTRQFSVMIDAGLPLVQCLEILAGQQENKAFQKTLQSVRESVEQGSTLSVAMARHPKVFDTLYSNMVEAGETGGILDIILQRLSVYIEKNVKLKRAVQSASIYPVSVMGIAGAVITLLLWKVVPIFVVLFKGLGAALPMPTRIVIALSNFVGSWYGLLCLILFAGAIVGLRMWHGTPGGRMAIDRFMLRIPVIGLLLRKIAVARFTRTLGTLISSGVPILEALTITARTSGNAIIEQAIMKTRSAIESGRSFVEPLKETKVFPPMVTQMIAVGEQTGALPQMLNSVSEFFEDDVASALAAALALIEPAILIVMGVVVVFILISLYLPIFSLGQTTGM